MGDAYGRHPGGVDRWRKEGSVSNQYKAVSPPPWSKCSLGGVRGGLDRRALFHDRAQGTRPEALEQVPHSDRFGGLCYRSPHVTEAAGTSQAARAGERGVESSAVRAAGENRSRVVAAVSGVAAAALVVAGLASGGAQQRQGTCRLSARARAPIRHRGAASAPRRGRRQARLAPAGSSRHRQARAVRDVLLTGQPAHTGTGQPNPSGTERTVTRRDGRGSPGTTVTLVPSPATPKKGPTGAATGGATSSPPPTPPAPNPMAPVVVVVGNTVTTVGSAVTTADQVDSGGPNSRTVTVTGDLRDRAVGAPVTGFAQGSIQQRPDNTWWWPRRCHAASGGSVRRAAHRTLFFDFQRTVRKNLRPVFADVVSTWTWPLYGCSEGVIVCRSLWVPVSAVQPLHLDDSKWRIMEGSTPERACVEDYATLEDASRP